jgi:hypothetical protein
MKTVAAASRISAGRWAGRIRAISDSEGFIQVCQHSRDWLYASERFAVSRSHMANRDVDDWLLGCRRIETRMLRPTSDVGALNAPRLRLRDSAPALRETRKSPAQNLFTRCTHLHMQNADGHCSTRMFDSFGVVSADSASSSRRPADARNAHQQPIHATTKRDT